MANRDPDVTGWFWLVVGSKRAHYFVQGDSLCGRWSTRTRDYLTLTEIPIRERCKICLRAAPPDAGKREGKER